MDILLLFLAGLAGLILLAFLFVYGQIWMQARMNGVPLGFFRMFAFKLRGANLRRIVFAAILAKKGGIEVPLPRLEAHSLAGGRPDIVVLGLCAAKEAGRDTPFEELAAVDLQGKDVLSHVRGAAGAPNPPPDAGSAG